MPDNLESMFWPFNATENYMIVSEDNNCYNELIYSTVQYCQRPTIFELRQQDEPQCSRPLPNPENEQDEVEDLDDQTENAEPLPSKPKGKKKHVYQAEQGYLVEEPTSESSEEGQESTS